MVWKIWIRITIHLYFLFRSDVKKEKRVSHYVSFCLIKNNHSCAIFSFSQLRNNKFLGDTSFILDKISKAQVYLIAEEQSLNLYVTTSFIFSRGQVQLILVLNTRFTRYISQRKLRKPFTFLHFHRD